MSFSKEIKSIRKCENCHEEDVWYQINVNYRELKESIAYLCRTCGFGWTEETKE